MLAIAAFAAFGLSVGCSDGTESATAAVVEKSVFALTPADFDESSAAKSGSSADAFAFVVRSGITLAKGEVVLLSASGSVTSPDASYGTVGPDGSEVYVGGALAYLPSRPLFGLFGRIGSSVFAIGREQALLAPEAGELELIVNGLDRSKVGGWCEEMRTPGPDCERSFDRIFDANPTSGGFDLTLHRKLRVGVGIATAPSVGDVSVVSTTSARIGARDGWAKTGVRVERGQKVYTQASGALARQAPTSQPLEEATPNTVGPNGAFGWRGGANHILPNRGVGRLFARVGTTVIDLGASQAFLAPSAGEIELVINHAREEGGSAYQGHFDVELALGVVPARGIDPAALTRVATAKASPGTWANASLRVEKGTPVAVTARGTLDLPEPAHTFTRVGPEGMVDAGVLAGWGAPLVAETLWATFGRVGGQTFYVGRENVLLAPASGDVEVTANASCEACSPSAGFDVDVRGL